MQNWTIHAIATVQFLACEEQGRELCHSCDKTLPHQPSRRTAP